MKPLGDDSSCDRKNFDSRASLNSVHDTGSTGVLGDLSGVRQELYRCLTARADALFELADAVLCAAGPVRSLPELSLVGEHRRGHGSVYGALGRGRIEVDRLRRTLTAAPLPRAADGRLVLAVDITSWLRPEAHTCPQRILCHTYGRAKDSHLMIPGWPYSVVCALESGRSSWTAPLDAVRLTPGDDAATVTAVQLRTVIGNLIKAGHWRPGDPDIWVVTDSGYDSPRLAFLLADLPVAVLGRMRSDRVLRRAVPPRLSGTNGRYSALRSGHRQIVESVAPQIDSPLVLGRRDRDTAGDRGHRHPTRRRWSALGSDPETGVVVALGRRPRRRDGGSVVAGVPAPVRYRAHLPHAETDPRLDQPETA